MTTYTQWQLARESAERYQSILTPAILGPFARALVDFAALQKGERVVDVGTNGWVAGVDVSTGMIEVARSLPADLGAPIDWQVANATQLPLDDHSVDVALCARAADDYSRSSG